MDRNIGDQLNKAFEAYRQVSIEKDNAQKELQKMKEHYEQYTQELKKQIEDQQRLISDLETELSATRQPSGEMKCEPRNHLLKAAASSKKTQYRMVLEDNIAAQCSSSIFAWSSGNVATVAGASNLTVNSSSDYQDMLAAFEAIQGKFRQIQTLTSKQKHHLKRFHGSCDNSNDQRFSMPIQCTDGTVEEERPCPTPLRLTADLPRLPAPLASRGTSQEDRDLVDSLTKLSVKFPPPTDSEYDFLNSAPERNIGLPVARKPPLGSPTLPEEEPVELPLPFVYSTSPSHSSCSSPSHESVRGPEQPLWSPELCDAVDMGANQEPPSSFPVECAFCPDLVPQNLMTSHLYLHFLPKKEAEN